MEEEEQKKQNVSSIFEDMDKEIRRRNLRPKSYEFIIDVEYIPFPSEETRKEAYYTYAEFFLKAKKGGLKRGSGA